MKAYKDKRNGELFTPVKGGEWNLPLTDQIIKELEFGVLLLQSVKDKKLYLATSEEKHLLEEVEIEEYLTISDKEKH